MQTPREFQDAAFACVGRMIPEYTALSPPIPAQHHVSTPSILGNSLVASATGVSGRLSSADASFRMASDFPESSVLTPSISR
jgi:hypothetical protein